MSTQPLRPSRAPRLSGVESRSLVSSDFTGDTRSGVVDLQSTMVVGGKLLKLLVWYDNEMGYVQRMKELAELMADQMSE